MGGCVAKGIPFVAAVSLRGRLCPYGVPLVGCATTGVSKVGWVAAGAAAVPLRGWLCRYGDGWSYLVREASGCSGCVRGRKGWVDISEGRGCAHLRGKK